MELEGNTQVQEKVKRHKGKEIKARMDSGVAVGWALLLCHIWDLTCGWDPLSSAELQERHCNSISITQKHLKLVSNFCNSLLTLVRIK